MQRAWQPELIDTSLYNDELCFTGKSYKKQNGLRGQLVGPDVNSFEKLQQPNMLCIEIVRQLAMPDDNALCFVVQRPWQSKDRERTSSSPLFQDQFQLLVLVPFCYTVLCLLFDTLKQLSANAANQPFLEGSPSRFFHNVTLLR